MEGKAPSSQATRKISNFDIPKPSSSRYFSEVSVPSFILSHGSSTQVDRHALKVPLG
jgi:hypothetical protein